MRYSIPVLALCVATASALQLPDLQPFLSAIPISLSDYIPPTAENVSPQEVQGKSQWKPQEESQPHHDLFRRQNDDTCPSSYNNCANIGAPGLCCSPSARCSADAAGHVACCPRGAACTGTIGAINTGSASRTATGSSSGTTSNSGLFVTASTTQSAPTTGGNTNTAGGGNGFVLDGTQTVATPGAGMRGVQAVSDDDRGITIVQRY